MVSSDKVTISADEAGRSGTVHILAVRYADRDVYCTLNEALVKDCSFRTGGRYDRNDPLDETLVALIPKNQFRPFDKMIWI